MVCDLVQFRLPASSTGFVARGGGGGGGSWGGVFVDRDPNVVIINAKRPMSWIKALNEN